MGRTRGRGRNFRGHRGHGKPQKEKDPLKGGEHVNKLQPRIDYSGLPRDDESSFEGSGAIAPELLLPVAPAPAEAAEESGRAKVATVEEGEDAGSADEDAKKTKVRGRRGAGARGRRGAREEAAEAEAVVEPAPRPSAYAAESPTQVPGMGQGPGMGPGAVVMPAPALPPLSEIPKKLLDSGALSIPKVLRMSLSELLEACKKDDVQELANTQKDYIAGVVIRARLQKHGFMLTDGCLEVLPEGFGFLRPQFNDYLPNPDDVFVSQNLIRRYGLKTGHMISGAVRPARESEKYLALARVDQVNGHDPNVVATKTPFEELTPLYPNQRLGLETDADILETRIVDLISPIGKGQRGLIVSPPRAGKTILLQKIANAISANNPECHLLVLLVDERPEEVTDMERTIRGEVIASTFDEPASRHVQVAHMVLQKAKRLVEFGVDVVILLDSITRLARAHNIEAPGSSKILSGGIDAGALQKPKQFFGAARNIEEGGSLTILGTALVDTGSRMDEVIFEEFKGTGNMELVLDRRLADRRIYPALDINMSGTRREDLLMSDDEKQRVWVLRRFMNDIVDPVEAMDLLLEKMGKTKTNAEFLLGMNLDK